MKYGLVISILFFLFSCQDNKVKAHNEEDIILQQKTPPDYNPQQLDSLQFDKLLNRFTAKDYLRAKDRNNVASIIQEAENFIDADNFLSDTSIKVGKQKEVLKKIVVALQIEDFPVLRKNYISIGSEKLWEDNGEVIGSGNKITEITFISGDFASHSVIKKSQETLQEVLYKLRFKKANYKWIKHDDDYTTYTITSKKDNEL